MAIAPGDRRYTPDHQWIQLASNEATIGITDFAQAVLGHTVHIELPPKGASFEVGVGRIDRVQVQGDRVLHAGGGTVTGLNEELQIAR